MRYRNPSKKAIMFSQLGFGILAVGFGGMIGGEPSIKLTRQFNEALLCEYRFDMYGKFPMFHRKIDDLVELEFKLGDEVVSSGPMERSKENDSHIFRGRDGDSFSVGAAFSGFEIEKMIDSFETTYEERIVVSKGRRIASYIVGGFGALLMLGFIENLIKMILQHRLS